MTPTFVYRTMESWPRLAWIASWKLNDPVVTVLHGSHVETHASWFGEIVWEGDYAPGEFDETDIVYGSGCRRRSDAMVFVSSASTVDRLHWTKIGDRYWVSNSLACLLANTGTSLQSDYRYYFRDFGSITNGIDDYRRSFHSSAGDVRLVYYRNLVWRDGALFEQMKPRLGRDLETFGKYREFLETSLHRLSDNMSDGARTQRYTMLATISTGFDSPTVAALARGAGLRQTLSFDRAREHGDDNGAPIAKRLGLEPQVVQRDAWRRTELSEVPFIASDAKGEDVYFAGAEPLLRGQVLLTGYDATRVWKAGKQANDVFRRADQSGLSLTEYRLWAGFVHCPVPTIGSRQTEDLYRIINSPEMRPWQTGAKYNKPICRRVLEEAGIPSDMFGVRKKAASVLLFDRASFLTDGSRDDFLQWRKHAKTQSSFPLGGEFLISDAAMRVCRQVAGMGQLTARLVSRTVPSKLLRRIANSSRLGRFVRREPAFGYLFPWAIEHAKRRYELPASAPASKLACSQALKSDTTTAHPPGDRSIT